MATPGGDSLCVLLPVPNLSAPIDWAREEQGLRDALVADLEATFGLEGLDSSIQVEHRMTPPDFAHELGAVDGNAFAVEPTLQQSAYFRAPNRVRGVEGMFHVGGGTHPGAGIPGVLLGAEVTAGHGGGGMSALREARQTTNRAARTFSWACRLLPGPLRDDVYLLYLVFRTLDDLVDEGDADATARVAAVQAWARGQRSPPTREIVVLDELASRHPLPRDAFADFCAGMRRRHRRRALFTEADVDRYCYQVAARSAS